MTVQLTVDNLTVSYGATRVLSAISFAVGSGEILALLGRSGCGKTTCLHAIGGVLDPPGRIDIGKIVFRNGNETMLARPSIFGFVSERPALLPWRTVLENVAISLEIRRHSRDSACAEAVRFVNRVGLEGWSDAYPSQLSQGMQQRVALARALASDPPFWLLDEPFGALDDATRTEMHHVFMDTWHVKPQPTIFVTHSVSEAISLASRIIILHGRPAQIAFSWEIPEHDRQDLTTFRETPLFARLSSEVLRKVCELGNRLGGD